MPALALFGGDPIRRTPWPAWPVYGEAARRAVDAYLGGGREARQGTDPRFEFERQFAAYHDAAYAVSVSSGTSALEIGLRALALPRGSEVLVTPYTMILSATAILNVGLVPIFVDIEPDTYNIDPTLIEHEITDRTAAIMPVHFGGLACDMARILAIAKRHRLKVIEDCAHAHGSRWEGHGLGSIGDVGCFSFGEGKNLPIGEGGMIVTNDPVVFDRANGDSIATIPMVQARRRAFGIPAADDEADEWYRYPSTNRRMSRLHATIGLAQFARLEEQTQRRADNAVYVTGLLEDICGLIPRREQGPGSRNANHLFVCRYDPDAFEGLPRELFMRALNAEGIPGDHGYRRPMNRADLFLHPERELQRVWPRGDRVDVDYAAQRCPVAERTCDIDGVWIPGHVMLDTREGMEQIATAVEKIRANVDELKSSVVASPHPAHT